jgi:hypothetical protein
VQPEEGHDYGNEPKKRVAAVERLDEAFCASANTPDCRTLEPVDMLVMMDALAVIADEIDANNEVMVRVANAYEACKAAFSPAPVPAKAKPRPRHKLSIVTTAVLVSSVGDVA